ncbi:MAG: hypothetical protein WB615_03755, partial [Candidatus Tumulicola sp.]
MKLSLNVRAGQFAAGAALAAIVLASCSSGGSVPSLGNAGLAGQVRQSLPDAVDTHGTLGATIESPAKRPIDFGKGTACKNPQFPLICVKKGHSATLGIKVTCTKGSKNISCGSIKWSTVTNNKGLTASFKPNPGNPTTETVHASSTIPVGHYSQSLTAKC